MKICQKKHSADSHSYYVHLLCTPECVGDASRFSDPMTCVQVEDYEKLMMLKVDELISNEWIYLAENNCGKMLEVFKVKRQLFLWALYETSIIVGDFCS